MNKPIIVEFNGLPGLGKTTVATSLIEELRLSGYKTIKIIGITFFTPYIIRFLNCTARLYTSW